MTIDLPAIESRMLQATSLLTPMTPREAVNDEQLRDALAVALADISQLITECARLRTEVLEHDLGDYSNTRIGKQWREVNELNVKLQSEIDRLKVERAQRLGYFDELMPIVMRLMKLVSGPDGQMLSADLVGAICALGRFVDKIRGLPLDSMPNPRAYASYEWARLEHCVGNAVRRKAWSTDRTIPAWQAWTEPRFEHADFVSTDWEVVK